MLLLVLLCSIEAKYNNFIAITFSRFHLLSDIFKHDKKDEKFSNGNKTKEELLLPWKDFVRFYEKFKNIN